MAWIESHQALRDHPKTFKLSEELSAPLAQVIGHLHCLWWWSLDYAPDGDLSRFEAEAIARGCLWEGDAASFVDALSEAGFLDRAGVALTLHDWEEYAGRFLRANSARQERALKANHARWHVSQRTRSPGCRFCSLDDETGTPNGVDKDSLRSPPGIDKESSRSPQGLPAESLGSPAASDSSSLEDPYASLPYQQYQHNQPDRPQGPAAAAGDKSAFISGLARAYEENVGMLTPHLADEFRDFEEQHHPPEAWGEEAVHEAAAHNKRSWAYVRAILRRWCEEGRGGNRATEIQEPYNPGIEVEPGIFMRGDFFPYTDPRSPHHHLYKPKPVLSEAEGDSGEYPRNGGDHQQNGGDHQQKDGDHPQDGSDHE